MSDDHFSEENSFSSESDSANDAHKAAAIDENTPELSEKKPAGALKFLTIIMFLLVVGLIAGPFLWGLKDRGAVSPDSSVLNPWLRWLGDLHVVVLHIPIGIFVYVFTMEILGLLSFRKFKPHLGGALALNSIFAIIAVVFGYFLFLQGDRGNAPLQWSWENNLMGMHMWLSIVFAVFVILAFISKMWSRHHDKFSPFYPIFMLIAAAAMGIGAHMGGEMVHKSKNIVSTGVTLMKGGTPGIAEEDIEKVQDVTSIPAEERLVYAEVVKPILQGKCWECHASAEFNPTGRNKIKGELEMTSVALLLKGGENADTFPTLIPGDPELSEMLVRVHLDVDDDEFMPKGKEDETNFHLTDSEIRTLEWWIANGSEEEGLIDEESDKPLKEAEGYETILADVKAFQPMGVSERKAAEEAAEEAEEQEAAQQEEEESLRDQLAQKKKVIDAELPHALTFTSRDSTEFMFTAVSFGDEFDDAALQRLEPVADAIVDLDLKKTAVTDEGMSVVAGMENLRKLMLNGTAVSDVGVEKIASLPNLESLSLFNTQVGDNGVRALREAPSLKTVYLSQTEATPEAVEELRAALPEADILYRAPVEPMIPDPEEEEQPAVPEEIPAVEQEQEEPVVEPIIPAPEKEEQPAQEEQGEEPTPESSPEPAEEQPQEEPQEDAVAPAEQDEEPQPEESAEEKSKPAPAPAKEEDSPSEQAEPEKNADQPEEKSSNKEEQPAEQSEQTEKQPEQEQSGEEESPQEPTEEQPTEEQDSPEQSDDESAEDDEITERAREALEKLREAAEKEE
jgi:uncharacterized membrane protein